MRVITSGCVAECRAASSGVSECRAQKCGLNFTFDEKPSLQPEKFEKNLDLTSRLMYK